MSKLFSDGLPGMDQIPVKEIKPVKQERKRATTIKTKPIDVPADVKIVKRNAYRNKIQEEYVKNIVPGNWFNNSDWKKSVKIFIKDILIKYIFHEHVDEIFMIFLDDENNFYPFYTGFVHKSVDRENDYDTLEKVGDKAINVAFVRHLYALDMKYGYDLKASGINDYTTRQLSHAIFDKTGRDLKFVDHVLVDGNQPSDIGEDLFEAFLGALLTVGELYNNGYGYYIVQKFTESMINNVWKLKFSVDERNDTSDPFTWFKQIYDQILPGPKGIEELNSCIVKGAASNKSEVILNFVLKPGAMMDIIKKFAVNKDKILDDYIVTIMEGRRGESEKEVRRELFGKAKKIFIEWGFNDEFIKNLRLEKLLKNMTPANKRKYMEKMKKDNFITVEAKIDDKLSTYDDYTIDLLGIRKIDRKIKPNSTLEFEEVLIKSYRFKGNYILESDEKKKEVLANYINN